MHIAVSANVNTPRLRGRNPSMPWQFIGYLTDACAIVSHIGTIGIIPLFLQFTTEDGALTAARAKVCL